MDWNEPASVTDDPVAAEPQRSQVLELGLK